MGEFKNKLLKHAKRFVLMHVIVPIIIVSIIIILLASAVYYITVDDGTYKEDDWTSVGYGSAVYQSNATINSNGTISTGKNAEDIWNELIENGSDVDQYLTGPTELAKLMNAELITKFPDMRDDPDEEIDWNSIDLTKNELQGIIKLKRSDEEGNVSTLKYTDVDTFYNWVEQYNDSGDEKAKENALSHFILKENATSSASDYSTNDMTTDITDAIVKAAKETSSPGAGLCQSWVRQVYANAGLGNNYIATAYLAFKQNCVDTSKDNIPVGAAVYGTGTGSAGHVGIYIGNGQVMDNVGSIKTQSLEDWIAWQEAKGNYLDGKCGWLGWGWQAGSPTTISGGESNETEKTEEKEEIEAGKIETKVKSYSIEVATWSQEDTTITSDDPDVDTTPSHTYNMTTTTVNYQELVEKYTMPFNLLYALLVIGGDEDFVLELADLAYNSDIEITIYDNYTKNTDTDTYKTTKEIKNVVSGTVSEPTAQISQRIPEFTDPDKETYTTTKEVVTQTNTLTIDLTKANVWIVDYEKEYTKSKSNPSPTTEEKNVEVPEEEKEYPSKPTSEYDDNNYDHEKIREVEVEVSNRAHDKIGSSVNIVKNIHVKSYVRTKEIKNTITRKTESTQYISKTPTVKEKTDKDSKEPNFVTIFIKDGYHKNSSFIRNVKSWLWEILETNEDTTDMVDLIKYLLYKATGKSYGVTEFDFNLLYSGSMVSVGAGDYVVDTTKSSQDIVITDVETLKRAFAGYSGSSQLIAHAQEFLDLQEQYHVNAVFAAAVSISETGAGRAGHATDGKNNWFNIECTCGNSSHGRFETYSSAKQSIERFFWQIADGSYYFKQGNYTVSSIGIIYCENADAPGGWIESTTTYMTQMFNAAGITLSTATETETGAKIVAAAQTKLGCPYLWGAEGPDKFDCSGLTQWCYKQVGISIPHNTISQKASAMKVVSVSEARVGDILWRSGHVAIYIGNNQYIHAPQTGDVVKVSTGVNNFTYALQFY